jgi:hypothetical protein
VRCRAHTARHLQSHGRWGPGWSHACYGTYKTTVTHPQRQQFVACSSSCHDPDEQEVYSQIHAWRDATGALHSQRLAREQNSTMYQIMYMMPSSSGNPRPMVLQWSHQAARPPAPTPACPSKDHALRGFADARSRELCSLGNPFRHLESVGAAACANGVLDLPVAVAWGDVVDLPEQDSTVRAFKGWIHTHGEFGRAKVEGRGLEPDSRTSQQSPSVPSAWTTSGWANCVQCLTS